MKKNIFIKSLVAIVFIGLLSACSSILDEQDLKTNPNSPGDASLDNVLIGVLIGIGEQHEDTEVRISAMWSGQLSGRSRQHQSLALYQVSSSTFGWGNQYNILANIRIGLAKAEGNNTVTGILQVCEALVMAKLTALYGDVPYSQAINDAYPTPEYDGQVTSVYPALITLLNTAYSNLKSPSGGTLADFMGGGDADLWAAAAKTLQARLYLHLGDYANAIASAQNGISDPSLDLLMTHGTSQTFDQNLNYDFFVNNRSGDTSFDDPAQLPSLMLAQNGTATSGAVTDNSALFAHYFADNGEGLFPNTDDGMFVVNAPHPILTFYENQLILAEASVRGGSAANGLTALNSVRDMLATGYINGMEISTDFQNTGIAYDPYQASDFSTDAALLAEISLQKYVLLLMQYEAWNHTRRMDALGELGVLNVVSTNAPSDNRLPGRLIYPQGEINTNPNTPTVRSDEQFFKLAVFE